MCCKSLWAKITVFSIFFFVGVLLTLPNYLTEIPQVQQQTLDFRTQATYFKSSEPPVCNNPLPGLVQKRTETWDWIIKNMNASKKQRSAKAKELEELNKQIEVFRKLESSVNSTHKENKPTIDLLYRENCYDF